jgi:hypothetical protein
MMPAWLAWNVIKGPLLKAAPWIGGVLALLAAWHLVAVHYRSVGRAEIQKTAEAYKQQRDSWIAAFNQSDANFRTAIAAVSAQNADARKLADAYDKAKAQDTLNVATSNKRWEQTQKTLSSLQDVIGENGGCKVDQRNLDALKEM